jgi:exodeoxyribonuclease V beta subunit
MNQFDLLHTPLAGRNLIEASAGTGKTFTIAGIYLRLVLEQRLPVGQILVVTFTEAATKELRERIRERLRAAGDVFAGGECADPFLAGLLAKCADPAAARRLLTTALRSFDEAAIHTIHGFCQRMLQENPFESGSLYDTELLTDQQRLLREIAEDYWRISCYGAPPQVLGAALAAGLGPGALLGLAGQRGSDPYVTVIPTATFPDLADGESGEADLAAWLLALKRGFFTYLASELPKRKRLANVRFFEDLLLDLHAALLRPGSLLPFLIRERYRAALIDEFQDTDPVQFRIFAALYPPGDVTPFFLIGDPKQAIYSFRGADIFAYMAAAAETRQCHTLGQNWRSEPGLIQAVNGLFASRPEPFYFPEISFAPVAPAGREPQLLTMAGAPDPSPFRFWFVNRREMGKPINKGDAWEMLPAAVAAEIVRILQDGAAGQLLIGDRPVVPGDIAVLVRANRQARLVQRALRQRGIPSVLCSAGNLFESDEAGELLRFLRAVAEPANEKLLKAALSSDLLGVAGNDLAALLVDEVGWEQVLEEFRRYHELWAGSGCTAMAMSFLAGRHVRSRLLASPGGERRLTNILHCFETLHEAAAAQNLGMEGLIAWLAARIAEEPKREEHEIRLETDEQAVQLVTIHKSKGLEYPIVFCPFCWAEHGGKEEAVVFHDDRRQVVVDIGSPDLAAHRLLAAQESLAESLRLLYVAVTRARNRCYLVWGAFKDAGDSAMHYLLHPGATPAKGQVALTDEALREDLARLVRATGDTIAITPLPPGDGAAYSPPPVTPEAFSCRTFRGVIDHDWRVTSFTAFAGHRAHSPELPDRDEAALAVASLLPAPVIPPTGIFAFPKGAAAGIFFHEIFEKLDFVAARDMAPPLVEELLRKHGFAGDWRNRVCAMVDNVLHIPLGSGFTLAEVPLERRLTELEFFFPLALITSDRLTRVVARWGGRECPATMTDAFTQLSFAQVKGMVRGFIDMVFEQDGRYYIVDWKSNHLGDRVEEYGPLQLRNEMERNLYQLQYLLYTVALDRYLAQRLPEYDYASNFGGVYYIFLRGIDARHGAEYGIYYDCPPQEAIADLATVLMAAGDC